MNLYHRLDELNTASGITAVDFLNGTHSSVIVGVIGRQPSVITAPVSVENRAALILLSPAGITISGAGSFVGAGRLLLTTQTTLKVGESWFDVFNTVPSDPLAWQAPIDPRRSSLKLDTGTLTEMGLSSSGPIEVRPAPGVTLAVDRSLILDSGPADLTIEGGRLTAGDRSSPRGSAEVALHGADIILRDTTVEALRDTAAPETAREGIVRLQAQGSGTLTDSRLRGLKVSLGGSDLSLDNTEISASRGLIQLAAERSITLTDSRLSVAPGTAADLLSPALGFVVVNDGGETIESVPGQIALQTSDPQGSGIQVSDSDLDASLLTAGLPGIESFDLGQVRQQLIGGNIFLSSAGGVAIERTLLTAAADRDHAGQISIYSLDPASQLRLSTSTLRANAVHGSGDLSLYGDGPVIIQDSTLEANTNGSAFFGTFNPGGEIRVASQASEGIRVENSILRSIYEIVDPFSFDPSSTSFRSDDLDDNDIPRSAPPGGLVRLSSSGGIALEQGSLLDVSSRSGAGGSIELLAQGGNGAVLRDSSLLAVSGDAAAAPSFAAFGVVAAPPRISILSSRGIDAARSTLDASTINNPFPPGESGGISLIVPEGGSGSLMLSDVDLLASSSEGSDGAGGSLLLAGGDGPIEVTTSQLDAAGDRDGAISIQANAPVRLLGTSLRTSHTPLEEGAVAAAEVAAAGDISPAAIPEVVEPLLEEPEARVATEPIAVTAEPVQGPADSPIQVFGTEIDDTGSRYGTEPFRVSVQAPAELEEPAATAYSDMLDAVAERSESLAANLLQEVGNGSGDSSITALQQLQILIDRLENDEVDLIIDNRDPENVTVTQVTRSLQADVEVATETTGSFDLFDAEDQAELQSLLGVEDLGFIAPTAEVAEALSTDSPLIPPPREAEGEPKGVEKVPLRRFVETAAVAETSTFVPTRFTAAALGGDVAAAVGAGEGGTASSTSDLSLGAGLAGEAVALGRSGTEEDPGNGESSAPAVSAESAATPAAPRIALLPPARATERFQVGEAGSLREMVEFLGSEGGGEPRSVPSMSDLQQTMRTAMVRLGSERGISTPALASDGQPRPFKPAILRLSHWQDERASGATGSSRGIDLVLVLPEGEPVGWSTEVELDQLRRILRKYYSTLAEQRPMDSTPEGMERPPHELLFDLVIRPALPDLQREGVTTLIISADSSLIDIPFYALSDGTHFLGESYAISVTPSLAFTNLSIPPGQRPAAETLRVNAGSSQFDNGLSPLPMVEKELAGLQGIQGNGVTTLLNAGFTPGSFASGFADPSIRQVHIASHAEIASGSEKVPKIFTKNEVIGLRDLARIRQRSGADSLDLVTLSACRSAVSADALELGFASLAVQMGSRSAIGTKYFVNDVSTSAFFLLFYENLRRGLTKAEALQATQRAFASGEVRVDGNRVIGPEGITLLSDLPESYRFRYREGFRHPYYWAGMQVIGSPF